MHDIRFTAVFPVLPVAILCLRMRCTVCTAVLPVLPVAMLFLYAWHRVQNSPAGFASCLAPSTCMSQGSKQSCRFCQFPFPLYMHVTGFKTVLRGFTSCHALSTCMAQSLQTVLQVSPVAMLCLQSRHRVQKTPAVGVDVLATVIQMVETVGVRVLAIVGHMVQTVGVRVLAIVSHMVETVGVRVFGYR